jgi:hypothetical protein
LISWLLIAIFILIARSLSRKNKSVWRFHNCWLIKNSWKNKNNLVWQFTHFIDYKKYWVAAIQTQPK